jgi:hypothetical protein
MKILYMQSNGKLFFKFAAGIFLLGNDKYLGIRWSGQKKIENYPNKY